MQSDVDIIKQLVVNHKTQHNTTANTLYYRTSRLAIDKELGQLPVNKLGHEK